MKLTKALSLRWIVLLMAYTLISLANDGSAQRIEVNFDTVQDLDETHSIIGLGYSRRLFINSRHFPAYRLAVALFVDKDLYPMVVGKRSYFQVDGHYYFVEDITRRNLKRDVSGSIVFRRISDPPRWARVVQRRQSK